MLDAGCVPGRWQAPEHPLLESQRGFGGKSGVTRQSLVSLQWEPILGFSCGTVWCPRAGAALGMGAARSVLVCASHPKDFCRCQGRAWTQFPSAQAAALPCRAQTLTAVSGTQLVLPLTCLHSRMLSALQQLRLHSALCRLQNL